MRVLLFGGKIGEKTFEEGIQIAGKVCGGTPDPAKGTVSVDFESDGATHRVILHVTEVEVELDTQEEETSPLGYAYG